jgi:hypothetical protein
MGAGSRARRGVALAAAALLLVACGSSAEPDDGAAGSAPPPPVSATPSPALTDADGRELTEGEARAFREATDVVVAYEQTIYSILASPKPDLDKLAKVAAQPQLDLDRRSLQGVIASGDTQVERTGPVVLVDAIPVRVDIGSGERSVVLLACVDRSENSGTTDGEAWEGQRQRAEYSVSGTHYLPAPGWAVARVLPPNGMDQPEPC